VKKKVPALSVEDFSSKLQPFLPEKVFKAMEQRKLTHTMKKNDYIVRYVGITYHEDKDDLGGVFQMMARKVTSVYELYGIVGSLCECIYMPLEPDKSGDRAMILSYVGIPWKAYEESSLNGYLFHGEGNLPPYYEEKRESGKFFDCITDEDIQSGEKRETKNSK